MCSCKLGSNLTSAQRDLLALLDESAKHDLGASAERRGTHNRLLWSIERRARVLQKSLSLLCSQWSPLMLHLLFFSMCQLIVVMGNLDTHLLGTPASNGIRYTWYWYLQDLFHGAGGMTVLVMIFVCGGYVTYCFRDIVPSVLQKAERCGATETQRLCLTVVLNEELQGFYIFYLQFNLDVTVNFIWALLCTILLLSS